MHLSIYLFLKNGRGALKIWGREFQEKGKNRIGETVTIVILIIKQIILTILRLDYNCKSRFRLSDQIILTSLKIN